MSGEPITTLVGSLTGDPELRFTPSGAAVANFTVASNPRNFNRQTNEWEEGEAIFTRCSVWRDQAEHVAETFTKGMHVIVYGKLKANSYEKDGVKRTNIDMDVEDCGPCLRWASAKVIKAQRGGGQAKQGGSDPWASEFNGQVAAGQQAQQQASQPAPWGQQQQQQAPGNGWGQQPGYGPPQGQQPNYGQQPSYGEPRF